MKPKMMSKSSMDYLFHHVLGGHESSHKSIDIAKQNGLISDQEVTELLKKNSDRLIERIKEFKIVHKLTCIFFALMFGYMQISCQDLEMRRSRVRTVRVRTSRKGGKKTEDGE